INELGPGGNFLAEDETIEGIPELWVPGLISRDNNETWTNKGSKDLGVRLNERAKELIAKGQRNPIAPDIAKQIDSILARVEKN
ncbi:MAG: trimethylamine methyltransferase family protein, partial [Coriobacteriales bacterium]